MNKLTDNPTVAVALDKVATLAEQKKKERSLTSIRQLLTNPEIQDLLEEILVASTLKEEYKTYLRSVFIKRKSHDKAIKDAFGKDLGYQEDIIVAALRDNQVVKEFLDIIKGLYIQFTPVASLKEFEMILNPNTQDKVKLAAIQDVKETAGMYAGQARSGDLPVRITINVPVQQNVQVNTEGGEVDGRTNGNNA